ncbi:MAG: DnaJ C-terminal domain-containing protein [Hyphomicrobiales bacterium]|nr:DnaJ C-terminal domain-containing protein [Hyphomicrobiales bacterium]
MDKDLYAILGLKRGASDDAIRQAYRKLAKQHHPDRNPGDKAAEEKFKRISAAFAILGSPEKRKRYDAGEIDEAGHERPAYSSGYGYGDAPPFGDYGDIFSDVFGARGRGGSGRFQMRGMDFRYTLEVDFLEAVNGLKKRVKLPEGDELDVAVPAGVDSGHVLRLKNKGEPGVGGGAAGDALIELKVRPHPYFERQGDDILLDLPITIYEAALGAKVAVPTITGRVTLSVPKGATSGQTLRLRGKGVVNPQTKTTGDQLVKLKVAMPPQIDDELAAFLQEWGAAHPYGPRTRLG